MDIHEETYDQKVGENLRKLRVARGLNQEQLAAMVSERGIPFRQQTIVKIEKGQRPLRLREADALTFALDLDIDALVDEDIVVDWATLLIRHIHDLTAHWEALEREAKALLRAKETLRDTLARAKEKEIPVEAGVLNNAATFLQADPIEIVRSIPKKLEAEQALLNAEGESAVPYILHDEGSDDG